MALTNKLWKLWSIEHYIWQCCDNLTSTNLQIPPEYSLSSVYFAIQHIFLKGILFNLKGPFTLRSLTRHKTRSNFPHASHWHRTHCDLIQLHNSTFWSWNKDETNKPTEDLFFLFKKAVWHLNARETHCYVCWIWYNADNLLLMAAILWIVTTFACVRQPSSFSVSTTRQWPLFTLLQDYEHNETLLKLSKHSSCAEWTDLVIKHAAEIHTVRACGFKPSCVLVSQCLYLSFLSHVVKSPIPLCMSIQSARPVQTRWTLSKQEKSVIQIPEQILAASAWQSELRV